jgi:uncharacterized membrane protein YeiB
MKWPNAKSPHFMALVTSVGAMIGMWASHEPWLWIAITGIAAIPFSYLVSFLFGRRKPDA